jgi:hypothetical protein
MLLAIGGFAPLAILTARFHWLGLPGVWAALGLWLAARSVILGRRWAVHVRSFSRSGMALSEEAVPTDTAAGPGAGGGETPGCMGGARSRHSYP